MEKESGAKICPVCGGKKINWLHGGTVAGIYHCVECGYEGALFLVDKEALPKAIRKRFKKQTAAFIKWDKKKKQTLKLRKAALKGWKKRRAKTAANKQREKK